MRHLMSKLSTACVIGGLAVAVAAPSADAAHLVRDINANFSNAHSNISGHAELDSVILFALDDGIHGVELWSSDGTPAGTQLLRDINPGPAGSDINQFTVLSGVAYFWADDGTNGGELWRSDGTTTGTFIVADIGPGALGVGAGITFGRPITTLAGVLYFAGDDTVSGRELWRSDGTRTGTYRLADINAGTASSEPQDFIVADGTLFFVAEDGVHGRELWK